jgi:DNA-binding response OmpR family regulator
MARILFIDDNDEFRFMMRVILTQAGYEVLEACEGEEGTRLFRQFPSEVICCDLFMPQKEGLETIQELRRNDPTVKIVAMSGGGFAGTLDMLPVARFFGADAVLKKPFEPEVLVSIVEQLLRGPGGS